MHLVREAGATVLVDGYNVTMAAWPDLALANQRERLVDALDELHARYGADVVVVFDGDDVAVPPVDRPGPARSRRCSRHAGVIADDVIVGAGRRASVSGAGRWS